MQRSIWISRDGALPFSFCFLPAIISIDAHLLVALSDWRGHSCKIIKNQ